MSHARAWSAAVGVIVLLTAHGVTISHADELTLLASLGSSSAITHMADASGVLYFAGTVVATGYEPWKSDGTVGGTYMIKDVNLGEASSGPSYFTAITGLKLFRANDGVHGAELWKSAGDEGSTQMVKELSSSHANPVFLTALDDSVYFNANADGVGQELFVTDGTDSGTTCVADIWPGPTGSGPQNLLAFDGAVYFVANDGGTGVELWKTVGGNGAARIKDINPNAASSNPAHLTVVGSTLFFAADNGVDSQELWKTDGTESGTVLVKNISPGSAGIGSAVACQGMLFFTASDGTHGKELWKSDGTEAGTVMIKDINTSGSSQISDLTTVGDVVFFQAYSDIFIGRELWKSDGTEAGTVLVKDIYIWDSSYPSTITDFDGTVYFVASDGVNFGKLWKSDGSTSGTVMVVDSTGTPISGGELCVVGDRLFIGASTSNGAELWMLETEATGIGDLGTSAGPVGLTSVQPNPFHTATTLRFVLPRSERVGLRVYDVSGRLVRVLVDGIQPAGPRAIVWNGRDTAGHAVAAGTYFCRFETARLAATRSVIRVR